MTLTEHARATLEARIQRLEAQLAQALIEPSIDPVHDFRVAIRRLSAALRAFSSFFPDRHARRLRRALRPALDAAAVVRDLDVDRDLLLKLKLPAAHPLIAAMDRRRALAAHAFTGHLYLLRSQEIPLTWLDQLSTLNETHEDAALAARAILPPHAAAFFKAGRKAVARSTPERLHAFRLEAKHFRYTLELFRPFYGPVYGKRLEAVRHIQSLLGDRQDCAVTAALLSPETDAPTLQAVHARAARLERAFHTYWRTTFDAPGQELLWSRYLSRRPPVHPRDSHPPSHVDGGDCPTPRTSP